MSYIFSSRQQEISPDKNVAFIRGAPVNGCSNSGLVGINRVEEDLIMADNMAEQSQTSPTIKENT